MKFLNFFTNFKKEKETRVEIISREEWTDEVVPQQHIFDVLIVGKVPCTFVVKQVHTAAELYSVVRAYLLTNMTQQMKSNKHARITMKHVPFTLSYSGKLIREVNIPLVEFNLFNFATVEIDFHLLLGGASVLLPTYSVISECEAEITSKFELQSSGVVSRFLGSEDYISDYALKLTEDVAILAYHVATAHSKLDYAIAAMNFAKLRSSGPIIRQDVVKMIVNFIDETFSSMDLQSVEHVEGSVKTARAMLDDYDSFKKGPLVTKLYNLAMYCLANEMFAGVGITMSKLHYSRLSQEAIKREYHLGPSFVHCLLDTMLFICEQGLQCVKLGSIEPLVHGSKSYQEWFDLAMDLQVKAKCLSNPAPHGFTKFEFLKNLGDAIEKGESLWVAHFGSHLCNRDR